MAKSDSSSFLSSSGASCSDSASFRVRPASPAQVRGTRLYGVVFLVHPLVPGSCCGPACWARAHRATAHATLLLRQYSSQCCGSRPSSLMALISVYSAPPGSYHGSRRSGDLCRVALHLAVLHPCALPRSRSVKQRSVAESSWPYKGSSEFGPPLSLHPFAPVRSCDVAARLSARSRASRSRQC